MKGVIFSGVDRASPELLDRYRWQPACVVVFDAIQHPKQSADDLEVDVVLFVGAIDDPELEPWQLKQLADALEAGLSLAIHADSSAEAQEARMTILGLTGAIH